MSMSVAASEGDAPSLRIYPLRDACLFAALPFVLGLLAVLLVYDLSRQAQLEAVKQELRQLARTAAAAIDGDLHRSLRRPDQEGSPEHRRALEPLVGLHRLWKDVIYVYTVIPDGKRAIFMLDTAMVYRLPGNDLPHDPLFTEYKGQDQELREALRTQSEQVNREPVVETYRTYLSAFAPFRDRAGDFVGIVGVDLALDQLDARLAGIRRAGWLALGVLALICGSLGAAVYRWRGKASAALEREHADARLLAQARISAEDLARQAAEASLAKSEFLANMSHELRTPLNAILGFGQLIQMEEAPDSAARGHADEIVRAGQHLLALVNDLIEIGRIESRHLDLKPEPVSLEALLRECLSLLTRQAQARLLTLKLIETPTLSALIRVDRLRFKQVLLNFGSNAIKYNRDGGHVEVRCEPGDAERVRICISDAGNGLSTEQIARLFIAFDRLGAEKLGVEGAGLGLVIAKRLVEAMDGAVGVRSTVGEGSTFWVEVPRAAEAPEP